MPRLLLEQPPEVLGQARATPAAMGADIGAEMSYAGRQMQALGQVLGEYAESDARVRALRYETELGAEAQTLSLDPDLESRAQKFQAAQKRLYDAHRPKGIGADTYDSRAGLSTIDLQARFTHATTVDAIKQSRANNALERESWSTKAANADTEEEALSYLAQAKESLEAGSLYLTPAEKMAAEHDTIAATIDLAAKTNPELSARLLDRLGDRLSPEAQAKLLGTVDAEQKHVEAQRVADEAIARYGVGGSLDAMLEHARKNSTGSVRNEAEAQIQQIWGAHNAADTQRQQLASNGFSKQIADFFEGSPSPQSYTAKWHEIRKAAESAALDSGAIATLKSNFDTYAKDAGQARKFETNWAYYNSLLVNPKLIGTAGYLDADLRANLATTELKEISKLAANRELGDLGNQDMITATVTTLLKKNGITKDADQGLLRAQIQARLTASDKAITPEFVTSEAQRVIAGAVDAGWGYKDSAEVPLEASLDEYKEDDPGLYRLAYFRASGAGRFRPADVQIEAQVDAIRSTLEKLKATSKPKDYEAQVDRLRKEGDNSLKVLWSSGVAGIRDDLALTEEEMRAMSAGPANEDIE